MDSISHRSKTCDEAYTTLNIQPPGLPEDDFTLRLKIDTGAAGNTLPLRTLKQMYGKDANVKKGLLQPEHGVKLTAYNGQEIECLGSLEIKCQNKDRKWEKAKFYVVNVPGPAVIGLPTSELLNLITINVDSVETKETPQKPILKKPKKEELKPVNSVEDLRKRYPKQFDTIGRSM